MSSASDNAVVRLYRPSSGTEGASFQCEWCSNCARDAAMNGSKSFEDCGDEELCQTIADTFAYDVDDPKYPREWCYDADDVPQCTAFVPLGEPIPRERDTQTIDMFAP